MVSSGKAWREAREQGIEFKFPDSGEIAALRPIDVGLFVLTADIPDVLVKDVLNIINNKPTQLQLPPQEEIEQSKSWLKFLDDLTIFAFVNPKVVSDPQTDNEISVEDVCYADKLQLFLLFSQPVRILRRFREYQNKPVAALVPTANDADQAEQVVGDKSVGKPDNRNARHVDRVAV